jgi:hypothetical protein
MRGNEGESGGDLLESSPRGGEEGEEGEEEEEKEGER